MRRHKTIFKSNLVDFYAETHTVFIQNFPQIPLTNFHIRISPPHDADAVVRGD